MATFERIFSNSFAGIAPGGVPGFVLAECVDAVLGALLHRLLAPRLGRSGPPESPARDSSLAVRPGPTDGTRDCVGAKVV